jgi:hydrogenase expression/formation protein HypE
MLGKLPPDVLADVLDRTGADDPDVLVGPAYGEDAAVVSLGDQELVVSSDPISLAAERVGTLGVHVAANDVAASGARPRWLTNVLFLPGDDPDLLDAVAGQIDDAAADLGVSVVGGHSEYDPGRSRPLVVLTCMGVTDEHVLSGGARPGDRVLLTKGAGVEGTAILATDFRDDLEGRVPADALDAAAGFFDDVSVVREAMALADYATAMHDPTEGGLVDGLFEMASASSTRFQIDPDAVPVCEETRLLCDAMGVDPFRIFGSGALAATVPGDDVDAAVAAVESEGVEVAVIGEVEERDGGDGGGDAPVVIGDEAFAEPVRDEMYALWEDD